MEYEEGSFLKFANESFNGMSATVGGRAATPQEE